MSDTLEKCKRIFDFYFPKGEKSTVILYEHSQQVIQKALDVAQKVAHLNPDISFIIEAALLHDIGICKVKAHEIGCYGEHPYLAHGFIGRQILESEKMGRHALVCERHVGVGITKEDIIKHHLPLPHYDMQPETIEEEIICYADKFFTKSEIQKAQHHSIAYIIQYLNKYGLEKVEIFKKWIAKFEG